MRAQAVPSEQAAARARVCAARTPGPGNRAMASLVQRLVVQREFDAQSAKTIADRLFAAMDGPGTDEEAIYGALAGRTQAQLALIRAAYKSGHADHLGGDLDAALADELTEEELARVKAGYSTVDETTLDAAGQANRGNEQAEAGARHLHEAMDCVGTEEDEIFNVLTGRTHEEILAIQQAYLKLTGRHLDRDLQDELSGDELKKALELIGAQQVGTFTNTVEQNMTEGKTTTVRGRFEYVLQMRTLTIRVPVEFKPDDGVTVPLATWQSQIDATWNKFAAVEAGGSKVPIVFELEDRAGADKSIQVKQNKVPGSFSTDDRANAGMWFPVMKPATAPHEFGHLIGLQDEYQRTHGDYKKITGQDITGPANASGRTAVDIAKDLHDALYLDDATKRSPTATTLLQNVGLIDGTGSPVQGDYAQTVQEAYNAAYSPTLVDDMRDRLPKGQKWTIQSVFSYASRSVMGNPDIYATPDPAHDHAVEARHLEEMVAIVRSEYPGMTWTSGPR